MPGDILISIGIFFYLTSIYYEHGWPGVRGVTATMINSDY